MKRGFSAESPNASRSRLMALLRPMLEINKGVGRPKPPVQLLTVNHASGTLQQDHQNLKRLTLQPDFYVIPVELAFFEVHRKLPEPQNRRILGGHEAVLPVPASLLRRQTPDKGH